jgi:cobalt-zinc-cadmium efflux system protein
MTSHAHGTDDVGKLRIALAVALLILLTETVGGFISHSLALLADAAHMLTDVGAAALGLWATLVATRPADPRHTYGFGRATVLAALANAIALFVIVIFIAIEAVQRFRAPQPIETGLMTAGAGFALIANLLLSRFLAQGEEASVNLRSVVAHIVGDAVVSGGVIVAGIIIGLTGALIADPIVSIAASFAVGASAWGLVRESIHTLMEGVPLNMNLAEIATALRSLPSIEDIHDVHVWGIGDNRTAASLHVRIAADAADRSPRIVASVKEILHEQYRVEHSTVEVEINACEQSCESSGEKTTPNPAAPLQSAVVNLARTGRDNAHVRIAEQPFPGVRGSRN